MRVYFVHPSSDLIDADAATQHHTDVCLYVYIKRHILKYSKKLHGHCR